MARSPSRRDARDSREKDYRRRSRERNDHVGHASRFYVHPHRRHNPYLPARSEQHRRADPRYDDRSYGGGRYDDRRDRGGRPRSRERKRSRERSEVRDHGRERDRDQRDYRYRDERDRDRDSKRPRRDDDDSRSHGGRREYSKERDGGHRSRKERDGEISRPSTADLEEEAKKARQAKVEAWKQKQLLKNGAASPAAVTSGAASPAVAVSSPDAISSPHDPANEVADEPRKKFDHKAIAKRAAAAIEREKQKTALGGDITIHKSAANAPVEARKPADQSNPALLKGTNGTLDSKVGGFGLSAASMNNRDKAAIAKTAAPLDDEDESERKLEKLPTTKNHIQAGDTARANDSDDQIGGVGLQAQTGGDITMVDAQAEENGDKAEEDEVDPLDAFMNDLQQEPVSDLPNLAIGKNKKREPQLFDGMDDEAGLDAMGDDTEEAIAAARARRAKKDIPKINHAKMDYPPFRKAFYSESVELAEMTPEEVDIVRSDLDNIKCRGLNVPKPVLTWSQCGFGAQILDIIRANKYEKPTSIQSQALPVIMSGRDMIGVAKTGSGKTAAFTLPMFRHIKDQPPLRSMDGPIGIIMAPTRELALQIHRDCKPYARALGLRAVCCYGGAPIKDQIAELKRGAEIVVATAGRMIDLLTANGGRVLSLSRVTYVVLDEADRMFDMGFEPQITRILENIRPDRQTVLFSATFPKNMEQLARKALKKPVEIIVGGRSVVAAEITQIIEVRKESAKFTRLLQLLGQQLHEDDDSRCLIFVERQETADLLLKELTRQQYVVASIHGAREQVDRDQAIHDFKAGIHQVLIATSVAARGLDVKQLKLVVNYDSPNHVEDYVHRAGRTGRAGNTGTAVTFVTPEQERFAPFLIRALTDSKQEIPEPLAELAKSHAEKVKSGQAQKSSSGFGGRGVERLEAAHDAEKAYLKRQYKTGDEPEDEEEDDAKKKQGNNIDKLLAKAVGGVKERDAQPRDLDLDEHLKAHLQAAMKVQKAEPSRKGSGGGGGAPKGAPKDAASRAIAAAAAISNRITSKSGSRPSAHTENRGPDAGAFHAILEINDFPQSARWKVTNRTNVAKILEATGTSITTKGIHYESGKEPAEGEQPKLYVLVEGDTEIAVQSAMSEMTSLLKAGTLEAINRDASAPTAGRYKV